MVETYTVCFSGTDCTRDEGEETRPESDKRIYCKDTGYIPVRIHKEISGTLIATNPSVTVRGVGENDWHQPRNNSEPLRFDGPLKAPDDLLNYVRGYSGGDQRSSSILEGEARKNTLLPDSNVTSGLRAYWRAR